MRLFVFFMALVALTIMPKAAHATVYLSTMPDMPLMDGLVEYENDSLHFDKPEGRIVSGHTVATSDMSGDDVINFYRETLPQLGWSYVGNGQFTREDDTLSIQPDRVNNRMEVQFLLTPHPEKPNLMQ